jgi:hypothetical protein
MKPIVKFIPGFGSKESLNESDMLHHLGGIERPNKIALALDNLEQIALPLMPPEAAPPSSQSVPQERVIPVAKGAVTATRKEQVKEQFIFSTNIEAARRNVADAFGGNDTPLPPYGGSINVT